MERIRYIYSIFTQHHTHPLWPHTINWHSTRIFCSRGLFGQEKGWNPSWHAWVYIFDSHRSERWWSWWRSFQRSHSPRRWWWRTPHNSGCRPSPQSGTGSPGWRRTSPCRCGSPWPGRSRPQPRGPRTPLQCYLNICSPPTHHQRSWGLHGTRRRVLLDCIWERGLIVNCTVRPLCENCKSCMTFWFFLLLNTKMWSTEHNPLFQKYVLCLINHDNLPQDKQEKQEDMQNKMSIQLVSTACRSVILKKASLVPYLSLK